MNRRLLCSALCCVLVAASPLFAQHEDASKPAPEKPAQEKSAAEKAVENKPQAEVPPVQTHHTLHVNGQTLNYTATAGMMPLKNDKGETEANIFFMAYTLDQPEAKRDGKRPLMFAFNGGPGSASVWLHLGAIGPRTVHMQQPDGTMPAPPYKVEDNENTWLTQTDLVFIDPVGTGYSRVTKPELLKNYLGLKGDTAAVGKFIRLYLDRYERWNSPLFLVGESYGTTRASALSGYMLQKYGVAFNGVVLMSTVLNFETLEFATGNDLPYVLFLPTYTATAWYHKKLDPSLEGDLQSALRQARGFCGWSVCGRAREGRSPERGRSRAGGRWSREVHRPERSLHRPEQSARGRAALYQGTVARPASERGPAGQPLYGIRAVVGRCGERDGPDYVDYLVALLGIVPPVHSYGAELQIRRRLLPARWRVLPGERLGLGLGCRRLSERHRIVA